MSNAFKLITIPLYINIPTFTRKRVITYFNLSLLLLLIFLFYFIIIIILLLVLLQLIITYQHIP